MKLLKYFTVFFLLVSCDLEQVVPYELPYEGDKLVVWSYIQPEETVEVTVFQTYPPLGRDTTIIVDNATVELYENDVLVATLQHFENGIYTSSFYPTAEKSYHLKVSAPDFEEVVISEKVIVPVKPEILDVVFVDSINFPRNQVEGIFSLNIDLKEEEYFTLTDIYSGIDTFNTASLRILSTTYIGDCNELFGTFGGIGIATDCLVNKNKMMFNFNYPDKNKPEKVSFQLAAISLSYINFSLSLENANFEQGFSFVSEPINVYTNMQGGYGLLAAYNPFIYEFEL